MAVVIIGGMSISTVFTLLLLPSLLRLGEGKNRAAGEGTGNPVTA